EKDHAAGAPGPQANRPTARPASDRAFMGRSVCALFRGTGDRDSVVPATRGVAGPSAREAALLSRTGLSRRAEVLGVGAEFERQRCRQLETVLGQVGGALRRADDPLAGPDPLGPGPAEPLVNLPRVDAVGGEEHLVAPLLDDRRSGLVKAGRVAVVGIGLG